MKSDFINCKNCTDDCHCKGKNITPICLSFKPAKITHADRFRSMSDEKLAEYIHVFSPGICPPVNCRGEDCCYECWLDWLRQEATDG